MCSNARDAKLRDELRGLFRINGFDVVEDWPVKGQATIPLGLLETLIGMVREYDKTLTT